MIFYHFTAHEFIERIRAQGLTNGLMPYAPYGTHDARNSDKVIWLTTDANPSEHGLSGGEPMPERIGQMELPKGNFFNKRAIRIEIVWPKDKVRLWMPWARRRMEENFFNAFIKSGGGIKKAKTWYISFEPIPPSAFKRIEILHDLS
jgi:hypothetical protein